MINLGKKKKNINKYISRCFLLISNFRTEKKDNWPISQKLEVEIHKRARLLGIGGVNLKKLFLETGVQVFPIESTILSF